MADLNLREAEARCEAATAGPWYLDENTGNLSDAHDCDIADLCGATSEDEAFIAAARSDLPAALALLREAVEVRRAWHDRGGTTDSEYGRLAQKFWKKIEALDPEGRP